MSVVASLMVVTLAPVQSHFIQIVFSLELTSLTQKLQGLLLNYLGDVTFCLVKCCLTILIHLYDSELLKNLICKLFEASVQCYFFCTVVYVQCDIIFLYCKQ